MRYHEHRNSDLLPLSHERSKTRGTSPRLTTRRVVVFCVIAFLLCLFLLQNQSGVENISNNEPPNPEPVAPLPVQGHVEQASTLVQIDKPQTENEEPPKAPIKEILPPRPIAPLRPVRPLDFTLPDLSPLPPNSIITYIPYTFSYPMLIQTLQMYRHAAWPNIVIIDNSWHREAFNEELELQSKYGILKVVLTTSHLQFAGMMAMIDTLAASSGHANYLWTHSDAAIISDDPEPYRLIRDCIDRASGRDPTLGVLFFAYDLLSMVRVGAGQSAPWDTTIPQYGADCVSSQHLVILQSV